MAQNLRCSGFQTLCFVNKFTRYGFARKFLILFMSATLIALNACSPKQDSKVLPSLEGAAEENSVSYIDKRTPKEPQNPPPQSDLNPKNMFGSSLRSDEERLDRLERVVQDMRNEFNSVQPSIRRLMAIEGDMSNIITELRKINNTQPAAPKTNFNNARTPQVLSAPPPAQTATPKAQVTPPKTKASPQFEPPAANGRQGIYGVRLGEHSGRTRIVLDSAEKPSFNVDIDNNEKIMVIDLPQSQWNAAMAGTLNKSNFISSYKVEKAGDGHMLIMQLKKPAKLSYEKLLPSNNGAGYRLVLDLIGA